MDPDPALTPMRNCHSNFWMDKIFHLRSVHQCPRRHLRPVAPQQREDRTTVLIQVGRLKRMRHQKVYQKLSKPLSESLWYQYSGMFLMFTFCIHPCHNYTGRGVSNMKRYFWGFDARRAREILSALSRDSRQKYRDVSVCHQQVWGPL